MRRGRVPVGLFGMLRSLCVITALLVLGSGAMRLRRPVVVIGGACMAVGTHSIFLVLEDALASSRRGCRSRGGRREGTLMSPAFRLNRSTQLLRD